MEPVWKWQGTSVVVSMQAAQRWGCSRDVSMQAHINGVGQTKVGQMRGGGVSMQAVER